MKKTIAILHYLPYRLPEESEILTLFGNPIEIHHFQFEGDFDQLQQQIIVLSEKFDAIAINGVSSRLRLGSRSVQLPDIEELKSDNNNIPILDGSILQPSLERWGVRMAHSIEPGIWANKRIYFVPQLNHTGMVETLGHYTNVFKSADQYLFVADQSKSSSSLLPTNKQKQFSEKDLLDHISQQDLKQIFYEPSNLLIELSKQFESDFSWADVIAGDSHLILKSAPQNLASKTILVPFITADEVSEFRNRGAEIIVTAVPNLSHDINNLARHSTSVIEACFTVISDSTEPLDENQYLNLLSELTWKPSILYLQPENFTVNRFGFITQPYDVSDIRKKVALTRFLPKAIIDRTAVHIPPVFHGRIENISAEGNQHSAVAEVMMLGGTPEEFTAQSPELVARRMLRAASMAEQLETRLIGVDTASREVSDALSTIAPKTNVALSSGQALTIFGVLQQGVEIAQQTSTLNKNQLHATVLNAGDPIVFVAAEVLASLVPSISLSGTEPDLLIELKRSIEDIHDNVSVKIGTDPDQMVRESDLIVLGRSTNGKRMNLNLALCQPGAVVCDFSQPSVISPESLEKRADITLIESAVYELQSPPQGKKLGHLPQGIIPAPFAEAALLAIKGKFIDFGLVGSLSSKNVYKIRDMAIKCGFRPAGVMAHGDLVPQGTIENRKRLAQQLSQHLQESPTINP
ncbi:MAG: hypothetical protein AAGD96_15425 [Chloroflexota bacterium]